MLLAVGLVGDAVAVAGVLMGLSGHVDFAKTWGALGLLVGVLSICILYLSDPPKARRETRAMGPSETPLRKSSGRRRRRRRRGFRLRLPFGSEGWGRSEMSSGVSPNRSAASM